MEAVKFSCLVIIALAVSGIVTSHAEKWTYGNDDSGPLKWHELFPEACSGKHQSPIDIRYEETIYNDDLKDFAIWYDPPKQDSKMYIRNNGHTVQVDLEGDFYVTNGGLSHVYKALQFHFHWGHKAHHGSEHLLDGKPSPIEMHLVTYNHELYHEVGKAIREKGGLAVLGTLYEISEDDNPTLTAMVQALKQVRDPEHNARADLPLLSLRDFLPDDLTRYYRYNGSLTTPGCFESVIWTVFDDKQKISHKQLKEFTTLLQFRHKHKHVKGRPQGSRHRRSISKSKREKELGVEDVLLELGIKGNKYEEAIFKSALTEDKMMADMSYVDAEDINIPSPKPEIEFSRKTKLESSLKPELERVLDEETAVQEDKSIEIPHSDHGDEVMSTDEHIYIQEVIVNNFRPIQPLNDRVVYRSFKSIETIMEDDSELSQTHLAGGTHSSRCEDNGADYHKLSTADIIGVFLFGLIFI